jgi:predicted dehydrogenase
MAEILSDDYGLSEVESSPQRRAPDLPYRPKRTREYNPGIGLIGCGGIAAQQLNAYRHAGFQVRALCDRTRAKAEALREKYFPDAKVVDEAKDVFNREDIDVADLTPHPADRVELIEAAIMAGKHVLSQKPFVTDLQVGERLIALAEQKGVQLAVNQNGRWAPHFSFLREALQAGLIGEAQSVNFTLHWDHSWIIGTPFEQIDALILYDFGIHWFDLVSCFFGDRKAESVFARATRSHAQKAKPPMLAQALIQYPGGQASIIFNADVRHGQEDRTYIAGSLGSICSVGPSLSEQTVTLHTGEGWARPALEGTWFCEGFQGAMAELLCAIEDNRTPSNAARNNLASLELCFAAIESSIQWRPIVPGSVRKLL